MSDEERDVDVESDEEDDEISVGSASASTQFMTQAEKRAHHNALERKRRDHIKESFNSLREAVPTLLGDSKVVGKEKASRAQILKKASDYIQHMRKKNHTHQQDIEDLRKQNHTLEQQIRGFEKAKATGQFATAQTTATNSSTVNSKGGAISAFDGGSDSESSGADASQLKRKRLKTMH